MMQTLVASSSERENPAPWGSNQWLSLLPGWKVFNPESCPHSQPNSGIVSLVNSFGGHILTESSPAAFTVCKRFFFFESTSYILDSHQHPFPHCTASCSRGMTGDSGNQVGV